MKINLQRHSRIYGAPPGIAKRKPAKAIRPISLIRLIRPIVSTLPVGGA